MTLCGLETAELKSRYISQEKEYESLSSTLRGNESFRGPGNQHLPGMTVNPEGLKEQVSVIKKR